MTITASPYGQPDAVADGYAADQDAELGGSGADFFSGGSGQDSYLDFLGDVGDTTDGT